MKSRFALGPLAALGLTLLLAAACTGQGQGQRCELAGNGNLDCQDGLICVAAANITLPGGGSSNSDICCPVNRTTATEDICKEATVTPGSDASIPDTGAPDTGVDSSSKDGASDAADGGADGGADGASSDASSDAPVDAPDGGG